MKFEQILIYGSIALIVLAALVIATGNDSSPLGKTISAMSEENAQKGDKADDRDLVAPFAQGKGGKNGQASGETTLPVNAVPLTQPHRTAEEIAGWLQKVIPESLDFDAQGIEERLARPPAALTPGAARQYTDFLETSGFHENLKKGAFHLHSYVQETPFLLNKGLSNNTYSWLFEVHIMASYLPIGVKTYEGTTPANQEFTLTVQVGRYPDAPEEGVLIESWQGAPRRSP